MFPIVRGYVFKVTNAVIGAISINAMAMLAYVFGSQFAFVFVLTNIGDRTSNSAFGTRALK